VARRHGVATLFTTIRRWHRGDSLKGGARGGLGALLIGAARRSASCRETDKANLTERRAIALMLNQPP